MATTEGSLSFTIKKNTGPAARTGTITIYDADGNASSVDVTVTQEGAPVTGSIIYEGDNALDAVMMNVNGEYVSWVLRKDADEIVQGEANHISETGWWYATPPVSVLIFSMAVRLTAESITRSIRDRSQCVSRCLSR